MNKYTPMINHYLETKNKYGDCVLFYRVGDFYEMFFDDAVEISKLLDLVLTSKACGNNEKAPMCGIPHHSSLPYIKKLISLGKKVALCEQVETPDETDGILKRDVVKIITPGTIIDEDVIDSFSNNYIMCILSLEGINKNDVSIVDISTGEVESYIIENKELSIIFFNSLPKEIIINDKFEKKLHSNFIENTNLIIDHIQKENIILNYYKGGNLSNFKKKYDIKDEQDSLVVIFKYILYTQKTFNYSYFRHKNNGNYLKLDYYTVKNLEIIENIRSNNGHSLFKILNKTKTSMGARMLKSNLLKPLIDIDKINERLDIVTGFYEQIIETNRIIENLKYIYDLERIINKVAYNSVRLNDLINLKNSLSKIFLIKENLNSFKNTEILNMITESEIREIHKIYKILDSSIEDKIDSKHLIKSEYNEKLSYYREIINNSSNILIKIEEEEKEKIGTKTLKIGFNKVFGYYIEITKTALKNIDLPKDYIRKQTLVSSERFINHKLKQTEQDILDAQNKAELIENELYKNIIDTIKENIPIIINISEKVAYIDFTANLAVIARENDYVRPTFTNKKNLIIKNGRHPIIEKNLKDGQFVPNDTTFGEQEIHLITGPNMAGKSTYMRQISLIIIMSQLGSYVPAEYVYLPIFDKILTRIGASDDISLGQSTFMVEMKEVANIINNATENSLIILDEIGRGTSTYDGMSLAYAIIEYIHNEIKAKTLVSTHYHELTDLEKKYDNIINYCMLIDDTQDVKFLRKVVKGKANKSYGIHVAQLAGIPSPILKKADQILSKAEKTNNKIAKNKVNEKNIEQLSLSDILNKKNTYIIEKIKQVDLDNFSPKDALDFLFMIKDEINEQ